MLQAGLISIRFGFIRMFRLERERDKRIKAGRSFMLCKLRNGLLLY